LSLGRLADRPLVLTPLGTSLREALDSALAAIGRQATVAVETEVRDALIPLVLAGAGTAIVPRPLASGSEARGAVVRSLDPPLRRSVVLVHRPTGLSPAARRFVELAQR
ncbi:MAG: LysR family transcriptional regulator substrate-binding protein, partial [Acidimicrobiia bacterium]|nr:LysR family transcriptional regulator substrate-binding protein [Acidimicrobiia bacterium]